MILKYPIPYSDWIFKISQPIKLAERVLHSINSLSKFELSLAGYNHYYSL